MANAFRFATAGVYAFLVLAGSRSGAQSEPPLFTPDSSFGPFEYQSTLPRGGEIHLVGDVVLLRNAGTVYFFEREPAGHVWQERPPLTLPSDAGVIDFDGRDVIVGGRGVARIYRRNARGVWRETSVLTPDDGNPHFGTSVAIDRTHAIVGAVTGEPSPTDNDHAYIFRRETGVWQQVAVLSSTTTPAGRRERAGFGRRVDIDGDTAIVQESLRFNPNYIFQRNAGGPNNWGEVKVIGTFEFGADIALDGDTAVFGGGEPGVTGAAFIANRDEGGTDNWGTHIYLTCCLPPPFISVDGGIIAIGTPLSLPSSGRDIPLRVDVTARNQGGPNAWEQVARITTLAGGDGPPVGVAVSGDTLMMSPPNSDVTYVLVSDIDGDGERDGLDPCVRDPLNNTAGGCRRDSSLYPNLDDHLTLTSYSESAPATNRRVGTATYTNSSNTAIRNPFFELTEINGKNLLINADEGPAGVGATLSPDVGDGVLSPGEVMKVEFVIRYRSRREPLAFSAVLRGEE